MTKKEKEELLVLFPDPEITKDIRKMVKKNHKGSVNLVFPNYKNKILTIDVFSFKQNAMTHASKNFIKKDDYFCYYPLKDTWGNSVLDKDNCCPYGNRNIVVDGGIDIITKALNDFGVNKERCSLYDVSSHQYSIKNERKKAKVKIENDEISLKFIGLKKPGKAFFDFLTKEVGANYAYFNRKEKTISCPVCEKVYPLSDFKNVKNNKSGICPHCGAKVTYKGEKSINNYRSFYNMGVIFQKYPLDKSKIISRTFEISKCYKGLFPDVEIREVFRTILGNGFDDKYEDYEFFDTFNVGVPAWNRAKSYRNMFYFRETQNRPYPSKLYKKGLRSVLKGTDFEHLSERIFNDKAFEGYVDHSYFEATMTRFLQRPIIESLLKLNKPGADDIVISLIDRDNLTSYINKSPSINEALGISSYQAKILMDMPDAHKYVRSAKEYKEIGLEMKYFTPDNIMFLHNIGGRYFDKIKGINIDKLRKYITKNNIRIGDYIDYLDMMQKITYQSLRAIPMFPTSFKEAHDEAVLLTQSIISPMENGIFAELSKNWVDLEYENENGEYAIIRPQKEEDIISESLALNHCVNNYIPQIINQERIIMFIRKKSNKNKPFVTMEIVGNEITQARKNSNLDAPEVVDFLSAYCKEKKLKFSDDFNCDYNRYRELRAAN